MRAFIVAALLVAVSGQSFITKDKFDMMKMTPKHELMMKMKLGYPLWESKQMFTQDTTELPQMLKEEMMEKNVYNMDELLLHPLFHEYMRLPLFRQYFKYPMFEKYVTSIYFQRFWHVPEFKEFFINPVLFYKHIYPVVTLFKTETPTITFGMDDLWKRDMIENKNDFPIVTGYERDLYYPTSYTTTKDLYHKILLNKLYNHLIFNNKHIVDPITGELKITEFPTTMWEDKMDTIYGDKVWNKDWILKKMLMNKMIQEPTTYKTIFPQEDMLFREKMMTTSKVNPLVARMLYGLKKEHSFPETFDTMEKMEMLHKMDMIKKDLIKKELIKKEFINDEEFLPTYMKKDLEKKIMLEKMLTNKFNDMDTTFTTTHETMPKMVDMITPMMGVRTFEKKVMIPDVIKA